MSVYQYTPSMVANGPILPRRFVSLDGTRAYGVVQSGVGSYPFGISQEGTHNAPGTTADNGNAADTGQTLKVYGYGSAEVGLVLGTGGCTPGAFLKPDANGAGVVAGAGDLCGALALEGGSAGEIVRVLVIQPFVHP
ncbi:MAG: hypothetical protein IRY99_01080 [Isosphaeraceae bacterium]|nr:hypothetical protein [Isosphaeraceae bacterium]